MLDCSVTAAWCFEDQTDSVSDAALEHLHTGQGYVPALWPFETVNIVAVAERRTRLPKQRAARFLTLLERLPIHIDSAPSLRAARNILALARSHGLSAYDASYLELALRAGLQLATRDRALLRAAEAAGVVIFPSDTAAT